MVNRIKPYLTGDWKVVFVKGRDIYTGQDVALLTRLDVIQNSATNFPNTEGSFGGVSAKPSKVLGVGLKDAAGEKYFVIVTHLTSKRSSNDKKRAAQANAIRTVYMKNVSSYDHAVVMGDLNDDLMSEPLNQLISGGLKIISDTEDYSYVYKAKKQLIDHILVSEGLANEADFSDFSMGPISDHRGVMAVFQ